jgi:hypothetical protein
MSSITPGLCTRTRCCQPNAGLAKTWFFLKSPARWVFLGFIGFYWFFFNFRPIESIFFACVCSFYLLFSRLPVIFKNVNESIILNKLWLPVKNL